MRFNAAESAPLHEFFDLDKKVANEVHVSLMSNNIKQPWDGFSR